MADKTRKFVRDCGGVYVSDHTRSNGANVDSYVRRGPTDGLRKRFRDLTGV